MPGHGERRFADPFLEGEICSWFLEVRSAAVANWLLNAPSILCSLCFIQFRAIRFTGAMSAARDASSERVRILPN